MSQPISGQWLIVYGTGAEPKIYTTAYTHEDIVVGCGYARRLHPHDDVHAIDARFVPPPKVST